MFRRGSPTADQASVLFFITAVVTFISSVLLQPLLGMGTNLWINEYVYILAPPLLLALYNKWRIEDVYRFRKTTAKNNIISIFSGVSLWIFAYYVSKGIRVLLDNGIGPLETASRPDPSVYQGILLVIGMVILAPVCEETFFRGFVQRAYESRSRKYGFVIAGVIFGVFHILNGISEVIPACVLGIAMGYLVHRTGSIAASMLFHAAANAAAIVLGGAFTAASPVAVPPWLHLPAAAGLIMSLLLMRTLEPGTAHGSPGNEQADPGGLTVTGIVFLVLSAIFLLAAGIAEIAARLKLF
jgi:membrane protease YdiL (CAAX protease family)